MLTIKNVYVSHQDQPILRGVNVCIKPGEVHVIMGPNGSGKSTLGSVLAGHEAFRVTEGSIEFLGKDLLALTPEARAAQGLFLGFQHPVEIPGVNNLYFLKTALNSLRRHRGEEPLDAVDFMALIKSRIIEAGMDEKFLQRAVNEGFSGGEKKRNEILQMLLLEPCLAVLDEMDSGLDIDALQRVAEGINRWRRADRALIMITHYKRLLHYVQPDYVHVLMNGQIIRSGDAALAEELEIKGYGWLMA